MEQTVSQPLQARSEKSRAVFLDLLKAAAMVAVVLYHAGFQPYGYLGVDIFFVVSGFLTVRGLLERIGQGRFSYLTYCKRQLLRLWPLVLLGSLLCLLAGYFTMLPDDYENLAESVVAANCFAGNILSCITTGNYWDVVNEYKPLMHMWYLGVLMQTLVLLPLVPLAVQRLAPRSGLRRASAALFALAAAVSFILCLLPLFPEEARFYYMPFRLFEFMLGALVACAAPAILAAKRPGRSAAALLCALLWALLAGLMLYTPRLMDPFARLVCVCVLTALAVALSLRAEGAFSAPLLKGISFIGKCTLSIFVWHQILLAFYRYSIRSSLSAAGLLVFLTLLAAVSCFSWCGVEQPLRRLCSTRRGERLCLLGCAALFCLTTGLGLLLYFHAGVARDIPELDVSVQDAHRHMHAEYCDRIYDYDRDFTGTKSVRVLVIGNSFGRDWANVLFESEWAERIELSYCFSDSNTEPPSAPERPAQADVIFYAFSGGDYELPDYLAGAYAEGRVYFVGNKTFGDNNGQIYARRFRDDYFDTRIRVPEGYLRQNELLKELYGVQFVDMIGTLAAPDGTVPVFTDTQKFISADCRHLTRAGAQYYASLLDLGAMLEK